MVHEISDENEEEIVAFKSQPFLKSWFKDGKMRTYKIIEGNFETSLFKKAYAPTKCPTKLVSFKSPENLEKLDRPILSCPSIVLR